MDWKLLKSGCPVEKCGDNRWLELVELGNGHKRLYGSR